MAKNGVSTIVRASSRAPEGLELGADGRRRCWWPGEDSLYVRYHDEEWGAPVSDDLALFEKLSLDGFQAGSVG